MNDGNVGSFFQGLKDENVGAVLLGICNDDEVY